jgi:geranylgeranyl pyrophosphate synthase
VSLIKSIQKLNNLYFSFNDAFKDLKEIVKNHAVIKQKIVLAEQMLQSAYMLIKDNLETVESKRQFNKIIKNIKSKEQ